jgi:flagellar basal-body rod protein FlgG
MDAQGRIVTAQGNVVAPGISIPTNAQAISINQQGQVSATLPAAAAPSILGQLVLTRFINKAGLQATGDNLFVETPASGTPQDGVPNTDGYGDVQQGSLEQANVEAVTEISDLIAAQRAYEMNGKVISAADQMLSATSNLMR